MLDAFELRVRAEIAEKSFFLWRKNAKLVENMREGNGHLIKQFECQRGKSLFSRGKGINLNFFFREVLGEFSDARRCRRSLIEMK